MTTWVDLVCITLSEISQTEKEISYDIAYMQNQKNDTNELIYKQTHRLTESIYGYWRET